MPSCRSCRDRRLLLRHPKKWMRNDYRCFQWAKELGCSYFDFRAIPEVLEPGEEMWGVYEFKKGFGGFSRLNIPTQDYVVRPLIYTAWRKYVEIRRIQEHKKRELEKAARNKS